MKLARFLSIALVMLLTASTVMAQEAQPVENEEFGVTITPPAKWEVTPGNDKAVASFKHKGSQSQIEVVGTKLMTPDVADVFFNTFHKTLTESNFEQSSQEETDIGDLSGTQTVYKFTHSGVTLEVVIFQFVRESSAWLAVGYMQDSEKDEYIGDFQSVVENMAFKE
jgi:hypothetical protein